ncbi:MAG: MBL fold metallo-hydrolase [Betaproteobacteria bacterium]|nr:MBL fold metallo-hydrolase [Betaproteobacteria bacterium]
MFHKFLQATAIVLTLVTSAAHAAKDTFTAPPHIDVTWLGGPTLVMAFNGLKILTDPMLGEGAAAFTMGNPNEMFDLSKGPTVFAYPRLTPFPGAALEGINLVVLSHTHEDHFDQAAQAKLDRSMPIIVPAVDSDKLKVMGFKKVDGVQWETTRTFKAGAGQVAITAVPARHTENPSMEKFLGVGNGYWIKFSQGDWQKTFYWTGDSFPTADVIESVKRLGKPDVMIPHVGGVGTTGPLGLVSMGADQVLIFAAALSPGKVLPIHHSTYPLYLEPISRLAEKSLGKPYGLDLISVGTTVRYR